MQAVIASRGDVRTWLIHLVGDGLHDDRFIVEIFRLLPNGDVVPVQPEGIACNGRCGARGRILTLVVVEKLRPVRDQIIIATRVTRRDRGVQLWNCAVQAYLPSVGSTAKRRARVEIWIVISTRRAGCRQPRNGLTRRSPMCPMLMH